MRLKTLTIIALFCLVLLVPAVFADINLANSKDWKDVYSVMLYSELNGEHGFYLTDSSLATLQKTLPSDTIINTYTSDDSYISNLERQLGSIGYELGQNIDEADMNIALDPETGNYVVVSASNYRSIGFIAPFAIKTDAWVFIVDEDNLDEVENRLSDADNVIGIGEFPRVERDALSPYFNEWINTGTSFSDSIAVAKKSGASDSVLLTDGTFLEKDIFATNSPILLTGSNKIPDEVYDYMVDSGVTEVVIVGNQLSIVGEQIRQKSEKKISVFIKFGQSKSDSTGKIYGLSLFPLPALKIDLDVEKVLYSPTSEDLIVFYKNTGNAGLYFLSTSITVREDGLDLGEIADEDVTYLGVGELLPVSYDLSLQPIPQNASVDFYTSFGAEPNDLDLYMTNIDKYGTPFSIPLNVEDVDIADSDLELVDVAYYPSLKRIGIDLKNPNNDTIYYHLKVKELIVNGIKEDLYKSDDIGPQEEKTTYISVELDQVDLDENDRFNVVVNYGISEDSLYGLLEKDIEFKTKNAPGITGFVSGVMGSTTMLPVMIIILLLVVMIGAVYLLKRKKS